MILGSAGKAPYTFDNGGVGFYAATIPNYYSPAEPNTAFNVYGNGGSSGILSTTASYDVNTSFNGTYTISAVPEPVTWAMMLIGFGGLGAVMRTQRRKQLSAVAAA